MPARGSSRIPAPRAPPRRADASASHPPHPGWNENEGLLFGPIKKAADFKKQAADQYGNDAATFLKYYPATDDSAASVSQYNFSRDQIFGVQNYTWANVASKQGKKVYVYRFTRKVPATGEYVKYGAFHTGEVPYAYDNLKFVGRPWEPVDFLLATFAHV